MSATPDLVETPEPDTILPVNAWQEMAISEIEELIKNNPHISGKFLEKYINKEISWDSFTPVERSILLHFFLEQKISDSEESAAIAALRKEDFIRTPPTPEEFLNTPSYLGPIYKKIYKPWREDLGYCLDPKNQIHEMCLPGAIRTGKTMASIIAQMYKLTMLSCLRNPPMYFGLTENTQLYFGLFTLSLEKAEGSLGEIFRRMMGDSPYFRNVSPLRKKIGLRRVLHTQGDKSEQYEVLLPQNIRLVLGSKLAHALSIAMISAIFDEVSFRTHKTVKDDDDENSAEAVYKQLRARIEGQFNRLGQAPGVLCVISSKKSTTDFLEAHIETVKNDPHTFVCGGKNGYSQWQVRPDDYDKERFYVFVGSSKSSSRIITQEEKKLYPDDSPSIIEVPMNLLRDFKYDINSALREHAGIATSGTALLFEDPLIVTQTWDLDRHPVFMDEISLGLKSPQKIQDFVNFKEIIRDAGFASVPKYHPDMLRVLHIDLSKSVDNTGICMGGVSELVEYIGRNQFGQSVSRSLVPRFWIDFCVGIKAPQGDQIDYIKIQHFINWLRSNKFRIHLISFDQYQCLHKDTLVNTNKGLIPIQDVKIGNVVVSRSGPRVVEKVFEYKNKPTLRITTKDKDILEGTPNHKIEVQIGWENTISNGKKLRKPIWGWKKLEEVKIGDIVHLIEKETPVINTNNYKFQCSKENCGYTTQAKQNYMSKWIPPQEMTEDLAEYLGLIWGDGHIGENHISLIVTDQEVEDAKKVYTRLFGGHPNYYKHSEEDFFGSLRVDSRWFNRWLKNNNLEKPFIPDAILQSNRKVQASFLRGLFATDGSVDKNDGHISFSTKHEKLAQQVRLLLRTEFGIQSILVKIKRGHKGDYIQNGLQYVVSLRGSRGKFLDQIGFSYSRKQKLLEKFKDIQGRYLYSRIISIEQSEADVYDLQVSDDHSYTANGFISHNSVGPAQMLMRDGYNVTNLSVDTIDLPYILLRDAMNAKNLSMYKNKILEKELINLTHENYGLRMKVDHPKMFMDGTMGSKDLCFTGDTKIKTVSRGDRSFIELVRDVPPGEVVYLYTIRNNEVAIGIGKNPRKTMNNSPLVKVTFENNTFVKCTPDHLFLLKARGYIKARELTPKAKLWSFYDRSNIVKNVTFIQETQDVYDITVEGTHNFALANGIFVHNSDALAGVIGDCYELLTNIKKHPDTANADVASRIIEGMNEGVKPETIPGVSEDVGEMFEKEIEQKNPYSFKL